MIESVNYFRWAEIVQFCILYRTASYEDTADTDFHKIYVYSQLIRWYVLLWLLKYLVVILSFVKDDVDLMQPDEVFNAEHKPLVSILSGNETCIVR